MKKVQYKKENIKTEPSYLVQKLTKELFNFKSNASLQNSNRNINSWLLLNISSSKLSKFISFIRSSLNLPDLLSASI